MSDKSLMESVAPTAFTENTSYLIFRNSQSEPKSDSSSRNDRFCQKFPLGANDTSPILTNEIAHNQKVTGAPSTI